MSETNPEIEIDQIDLLNIPDIEKNNLRELFSLLNRYATDTNQTFDIKVVGGVIKKEWPRKDIDVIFSNKDIENTPIQYYEKVVGSYKSLEKAIDEAVLPSGRYTLGDKMFPAIDEEFGDPNILKHNGSVVVVPAHGTKIEIINNA